MIDWLPEMTGPATPFEPQPPTGQPERKLSEAWSGIRGASTTAVFDYLTDKTIVLEKRSGYENAVLTLEELPVYRQLRISLTGVKGDPIRDEDSRIYDNNSGINILWSFERDIIVPFVLVYTADIRPIQRQ